MAEDLFDTSGTWDKNVKKMRSMIGLSMKKINSLFKKEQEEFEKQRKNPMVRKGVKKNE
jgi:hypothetical protein